MKKRAFLWAGSVALGAFVACSQADKHPALLGDCDACQTPIIGTAGSDASTPDAAKDSSVDAAGDAGAKDAALDAPVDASLDVNVDVAIPDGGLPDVIDLDGAAE